MSPSEELRSTSLKRQLGEVQRMSDERAAGMMRDRATLIDAHEKRSAADAATIQGLQREVEELQAKLTHLTRGGSHPFFYPFPQPLSLFFLFYPPPLTSPPPSHPPPSHCNSSPTSHTHHTP